MKNTPAPNSERKRQLSVAKIVAISFVVLIVALPFYYHMCCAVYPRLSRERIARNNTNAAIRIYVDTYRTWPKSRNEIIESKLNSYGTTYPILEFRLQYVDPKTKDATYILLSPDQPHPLLKVLWPDNRYKRPGEK